jgi:hypothetical protein
MFKSVKSTLSIALLSGFAITSSSSVSADEIALTFRAQDLTIAADFIAFDRSGYVIMTQFGEMHVPASMVTCEGADCRDAAGNPPASS